MIEQNVQVLRRDRDSFWVRMGSRSGCVACDNGNGCGAGLFAHLMRRQPIVLKLARNSLDAEVGQMLTLAFPEQIYIKMVLASYGWPLIAALGGAFGGYRLGEWLQLTSMAIDITTLIGGVLAALLIVLFIRKRNVAETFLGSLDMTICNLSNTPNMCIGNVNNPEHK